MKLKELLVPLALAFTVIWGGQLLLYFTTRSGSEKQEESAELRAGQSFIAPRKEQLIKPLLTDVDYSDEDKKPTHTFFTVETQRMVVTFDTCGGAIVKLVSKRLTGTEEQRLTFFDSEHQEDYEKYAFLVALDRTAPLKYELLSQQQEGGVATVVMEAVSAQGRIRKEFKVSDADYKVELRLAIVPNKGVGSEGIVPRVFLPAPKVSTAQGQTQGVLLSDTGSLERKKIDQLEGRLWVMPPIFGAEDRYFLQTLVADTEHFVQRAYYKTHCARNELSAILEGPVLQEAGTWTLVFYCGPKQIDELQKVDARLEPVLDYGWLGPIAKIAVQILRFLYSYVHNYGIAIILLTLLMKLLLVPFTFRMEKSARKAAEIKKKLEYLEQKYKDNPEQLRHEKAELVRKHGIFDVGCLSMFAQLPLLLGLNRALSTSIELYKAPFFGWIKDLSAIDPWYILPMTVGLGLLVHSGRAGDPRQRLVTVFMALVITGLMSNFAAGLVLFIAVSTWSSIVQSRLQKAFKV